MDETPLISVIVPIYNVAPYLRKCLDSLKGQTLKKIEVICIDDGSTDESGEIAEEYSTDPRFRVIHTENRGLSAARNRGIDEARADWIMFVDSDDWVEPGFCEIPYKAAVENGADLVIFGLKIVEKGHIRDDLKPVLLDGEINEFLAHEHGETVAWNKLYKAQLFEDIRYPENRVYEDIAITHKIVHKANKRIYCNEFLYDYVIRKSSISHTNTTVIKTACRISMMERCFDLISYGYPIEKIDPPVCASAIGFLSVIPKSDDKLYEFAMYIVNSTKGFPEHLTIKQKIALIMWRIDSRLFYMISKVLGRQSEIGRFYI